MTAECTDRLVACRAEVAQLREENEQLLAANRYSLDMFNMINADYQKARSENDRYRAALVEITESGITLGKWQCWCGLCVRRMQIAKNALATHTESGQLSDDSGQIAEASK